MMRTFIEKRKQSEAGFTLMEIVASMLMLSIMGALTMQLVLAMMETRELTIRYENIALAARAASERAWDAFHASEGDVPDLCDAQFRDLDGELDVMYECDWLEEKGGSPENGLYEVKITLRRISTQQVVGRFTVLALMGGYN